MGYTENLSQELAVVGTIPPQSLSGTYTITGIDTSYFRRVLFVLNMGVVSPGGTVAMKAQACATAGGSYVDVDATNAAIVTATVSNKIHQLEVKMEKLSAAASVAGTSYRFLGCLVTTAVAATIGGVTAWAAVSRNKPASAQNIAAVSQIVVY